MAGIPKRQTTDQSAFLPTRKSLKILLLKWTIAVSAMAVSTGKYNIITAVRMVPKPKPEKKVSMAARKVVNDMTAIVSIEALLHAKSQFSFQPGLSKRQTVSIGLVNNVRIHAAIR